MPKRLPIFEFQGLSGFRGSSPPEKKYHRSSRHTDESPRPPSVGISSRYRSVSSHHSRTKSTRRNRHKRSTRNYSRRAHHASSHSRRQRRFSPANLHERNSDPSPDPSPIRHRGRYAGSPPPFHSNAANRNLSPSNAFPAGTRISPNNQHGEHLRSPRPSGYPDDYDPEERAVDPRLEHSFSPSGRPLDEEEEEEEEEGFQQVVYGGARRGRSPTHERTHRRHRRHRRNRHRRGRRRRRRDGGRDGGRDRGRDMPSDRNHDKSENRDHDTGGNDAESDSVERDADGNPIESSDRQNRSKKGSKKDEKDSEEDGKGKKGKKRNIAKVVALAAGALVVGLVAKKVIARRRKKKADAEAKIIAAQQEAESEAAGPYGDSGGQLYVGSNPLQLKVPKTSFSVKVPESEAFIVERGGKYNRRLNPGSNTLIPFIDRIAFRFSLKEVGMAIPQQQCYTRENVSVIASALLFAKVEDAVAAAYGVDDARRSLMLVAQISMRKEIARLGLEQMLLDRDGLGDRILVSINRASRPWGIRCTRFEIRDLDIPEEIRAAFAHQAQIERQVQADNLANQAMKNRADGELHAQMRMSQAQGIDAVNRATAEAQAISERGQAIAGALRDVAEVAEEPGGKEAMHMRIAEQYIHAYMKAAEGQKDLPPVPNAEDIADALGKGLGLLDTFAEPGSKAMDQSAAQVGSSSLPVPRPALQQGNGSGHGIVVKPAPAASSAPGTHQGTVQEGVPPLVGGTQQFPQSESGYPQPGVPGGTEASSNSQSTHRIGNQSVSEYTGAGKYAGPSYPQA